MASAYIQITFKQFLIPPVDRMCTHSWELEVNEGPGADGGGNDMQQKRGIERDMLAGETQQKNKKGGGSKEVWDGERR